MEMKPNSEEARKAFDLSFARMDIAQTKMSAVFRRPFICEIAGSGFDKPHNCEFSILRFPRILKIHQDRDLRHVVCLDELQNMATIARTVPVHHALKQEIIEWVGKLNQVDRGTNGKIVSWDHTDDEEEPHGAMEDAIPAARASETAHKAKTRMSALFTQNDWSKTVSIERRSNEGEIACSLASTDFTTGDISESHSPFSQVASSCGKTTKRIMNDFTAHENPPKRPRVSDSANSENEATCAIDKTASNHRPPLQEIMNLSRPTIARGLKNDLESQQVSNQSYQQRSEKRVDADQLVRKRHCVIEKTPTDPSSPVENAFLSTRTTIASKSTEVQEFQLSPHNPISKAMSRLHKPPCTKKASIPNLKDCSIVLGPCLLNKMPRDLTRLLEEYQPSMLSLPPGVTSEKISKLEPRGVNGSRILFLVDANDTAETTAASLHEIAPCLQTWHPLSVHVWDWRIVLLQRNLNERKAWDEGEMADKWWIATMSWGSLDPDSESVVLVEWADGGTTVEPLDTFEKLKNSSKM